MSTEIQDKLAPGDRIHFVESGVTFSTIPNDLFGGGGRTSRRGDELVLTEAIIEANSDRNGDTWLDLTEHDQRRVHGRVLFRRGPWPTDAEIYVRGSSEWIDAREAARRAAWSLQDPSARNEALAAVHGRFGPPPVTSRTINEIRGDDERQANAEGTDDSYV